MTSPITSYGSLVAVVTGGASGVGRSLCSRLLARGATVVASDVEQVALDATVQELSSGGAITGVLTDVTDPKSVLSLADQVFEQHGKVNVLFNNAGVGAPSAKVWETTPNDWLWVHSVNVFGVAYGIQAFVPRMLASGEPGFVANTTSGDGAIAPLPTASVYASSKAAVAIMTECLSAQLEEIGAPIGAGLVFPSGKGLMGTGMWTTDRNRHDKWAREVERPPVSPQIEAMKQRAADMKGQLVSELDNLADAILDGILEGRYVLTMGEFDGNVDRLRARADRYAQLQNPTVGGTGH